MIRYKFRIFLRIEQVITLFNIPRVHVSCGMCHAVCVMRYVCMCHAVCVMRYVCMCHAVCVHVSCGMCACVMRYVCMCDAVCVHV